MDRSGPPSNKWFLGHTQVHNRTTCRSVQRFCSSHNRDKPIDRQTDRQTTHATPYVTIGRMRILLRCGLTNNTLARCAGQRFLCLQQCKFIVPALFNTAARRTYIVLFTCFKTFFSFYQVVRPLGRNSVNKYCYSYLIYGQTDVACFFQTFFNFHFRYVLILGHIAVLRTQIRSTVTEYRPSIAWSVGLSRLSAAKTAEPINISFGMWNRAGRGKHGLDWVHICATWRIRLNPPRAAAMRPFRQITLTHLYLLSPLYGEQKKSRNCRLKMFYRT